MSVETIDYNIISPGVRELVRELREVHGLNTTDSGDGTNYEEGMGCSIKERHVFVITTVENMVVDTQKISKAYPGAWVELSWSPGQSPNIMVLPDGLVHDFAMRDNDGN